MKQPTSKAGEKKVYGQDTRFARIHEMIKMRVPISLKDKNYYFDNIDKYEKQLTTLPRLLHQK